MSHALSQLLAERLVSGLRRKSIQTPSRWAEEYRVMGKPYPGKWTFRHHPWLREMHDSKALTNVGQKSAQMGYTETVLNLVFYKIDVEAANCLYILPNKVPDASEFSASRFDPAVEMSEHLGKTFSDVQNVGHKRAGSANLYIRGSQSRSGLKSVPAGFLVFDELDEMNQENISLAHERQSGQVDKQDWKISTPTVPNFGINKFYNDSTREHFFFPCPHCGKATELIFPECLVVTAEDYMDAKINESHLICKECKHVLDHANKMEWLSSGYWVAQFSDRDSRGFYVNQLYSSTVSPASLAKTFLMSTRDKSTEQEFYNSKLGIAHVVEGARVNDEELEKCIGEYKRLDSKSNGLVTMGVDVGSWLHIVINEWEIKAGAPASDVNMYARARVIWFGKMRNFEELDTLMRQYSVTFGVIDAQPEKRSSFAFANRFWGKVKICYYGNGVSGKTVNNSENNDQSITVDRTSWLDMSLGRYHLGKKAIIVPHDIDMEFRDQMKSLVRRYEKDKNGNPTGRYVDTGPDHYAHALNYAEIALPFAVSKGRVETIHQRVI
jgi:hypothetical protein